jgi:hypothetical protein
MNERSFGVEHREEEDEPIEEKIYRFKFLKKLLAKQINVKNKN